MSRYSSYPNSDICPCIALTEELQEKVIHIKGEEWFNDSDKRKYFIHFGSLYHEVTHITKIFNPLEHYELSEA